MRENKESLVVDYLLHQTQLYECQLLRVQEKTKPRSVGVYIFEESPEAVLVILLIV